MREALIIARWEMNKLIGNWRKAVTVFLMPAVLMMLALNIFPLVVNYISTGSVGMRSVFIIDAPQDFKDFTEEYINAGVYKYDFFTQDEFERKYPYDDYLKELRNGRLCVFFDEEDDTAYLTYSDNSLLMESREQQFEVTVMEPYVDQVVKGGGSLMEVDAFNPVTTILDHRTDGNTGASRILPGITLLLMYYCVYSLSCDMFAAERDRGFLAKLVMTPVSKESIIGGKLMTIMAVVTGSALISFVMLFFSSWLNRSNDPMSLLPFGMLLMPIELIKMLLVIPPTALLMSAVTLNIVLSLRKMQDIIINLQMPLVYFLIEFFVTMFRGSTTVGFEFMIPLHNTIAYLINLFTSNDTWPQLLMVFSWNLLLAILLMRKTLKKEIV